MTWNSAADLADCLQAVRRAAAETPDVDVRAVIVDNASTDGSAELARSLGATVVANRENRGFASGVNQGMAALPGDYYLVLNPDAVLQPGALAPLLAAAAEPGVGAAGPRFVDAAGNRTDEFYYLKEPSLAQVALYYTRLGAMFDRPRLRCRVLVECGLSGDRDVGSVPGGCLLTRADVMREVGPLDEGFLLWFEDVDWCRRARRAGYRMRYVAASSVRHEGGASFRRWKGRLDKRVLFYTSMRRYFRKHRPWAVPGVVAFVVVDRVVRFAVTGQADHLRFAARYLRGDAALPRAPDAAGSGDSGVGPWVE